MVEQGANFKATDNKGKTPLDYASERGQEDVAQYLKEMTQSDWNLFCWSHKYVKTIHFEKSLMDELSIEFACITYHILHISGLNMPIPIIFNDLPILRLHFNLHTLLLEEWSWSLIILSDTKKNQCNFYKYSFL